MFGDLNQVELIGNITNDITVRYTAGGTAVCSFGVATNRNYKDGKEGEWKEEVTFHNIVVWAKEAEMLAQRARKGTRLYIQGRLQTRSWDDAEGKKNYKTEITAEKIILLDRYEKGAEGSFEPRQPGQSSQSDDTFASQKSSGGASKARPAKSAPADDIIEQGEYKNGDINPDDLPF